MNDEVKRQPVAIDLHRHGIDEKGHVVIDDLDDRVRRLPAVLFDRRVEDAHARMTRLAPAREVPVRQSGAVQVRRLTLEQILRVDLTVIAFDERLNRGALLGGHFRSDELRHVAQSRRSEFFGRVVHESSGSATGARFIGNAILRFEDDDAPTRGLRIRRIVSNEQDRQATLLGMLEYEAPKVLSQS